MDPDIETGSQTPKNVFSIEPDPTAGFRHVGFWMRGLAYLLDMIPILVIVGAISWLVFDLDDVIRGRFTRLDDAKARADFLQVRNWIRNLSFLLWLGYCAVAECSPLQGTLGKWLLGMRVVDRSGNRLSFSLSLIRTVFKLFSYVACGIGFLWIAFTKQKQGWHDKVAHTFVVRK